jgi:glucose/arabinose dehydrogenase
MQSLFTLLTLFLLTAVPLFAQNLPANFSRVTVGGNTAAISNPTVMAFAPDGRIFVAQQNGVLRVFKNDQLLPTPFISLTVNSDGERGLIGIAFDPDFATNSYIYLYYTTATTPLHNRISRFTANGDVVLAGSEVVILELDNLSSATNHNGGALAFGNDGKLYVAIGENANGSYAQNLEVYHGKLLRINKDGTAPPDNPFYTTDQTPQAERRKRIWAYGLRNPYTFSIHPTSGRILLNDVGQSTWEEVNDATVGGKNFGWPTTEGVTSNPSFTSPIYAYHHTSPPPVGCAITGGTFFSPATTNYPATYQNKYFILDLCSAWIYYFDPNVASPTATVFSTSVGNQAVSLMTGPDGNLYYLSRTSARLYKVVYSPPTLPPTITVHPQPATIFTGANATFAVTATGTQPFTYQWQKNTVNINGATQPTLTISNAQLADGGNYRVVVTNSVTSVTSNPALLTVNSPPPVPVISQQPAPTTVTAGQPATFNVIASGDGTLSYQWYREPGTSLPGKTSATLTIELTTMSDAGNYYVTVTNINGTVSSASALLTVNAPNAPPVAEIVKPLGTDIYRAGTSIAFEGTGTDNEDGVLTATAFTWDVHFHHDTHMHDQPAITGVKSGSFAVPSRGETSANVWYRIILTVTDASGLTSKDSVDVHPSLSTLSFSSQPLGLQILIDGQPFSAPFAFPSVEGLERDISVAEQQSLGDASYSFVSWSNGGQRTQTIVTPADDIIYNATYAIITGLEDLPDNSIIYPNPANGFIYIADSTVKSVMMINSVGKSTTLATVNEADRTSVDVSHLSPGMYMIRFSSESSEGTRKILIRR